MTTKMLWIYVAAVLLSGCIIPTKKSESGINGAKDVLGKWVVDAKETQRIASEPNEINPWTQSTTLTVHTNGTIERFRPVSYGDAYQKGSWCIDRDGMHSTTKSGWGSHQATYQLTDDCLYENMEYTPIVGSKQKLVIVYRRGEDRGSTQQAHEHCVNTSTIPSAHPSQLHDVTIPPGRLGHPLGTYLTIEGVRAEQGKVGTRNLLVDTVNGNKLQEPIGIWIENVKDPGLPTATRCVVKGYESGAMIGIPYPVAEAEKIPLPQAEWQFRRYFIVTSVVEPTSLKKE